MKIDFLNNLVLALVFVFVWRVEGIYSFSIMEWMFGKPDPTIGGGLLKQDFRNSEYGECDWHDSSLVPNYPISNMNEDHKLASPGPEKYPLEMGIGGMDSLYLKGGRNTRLGQKSHFGQPISVTNTNMNSNGGPFGMGAIMNNYQDDLDFTAAHRTLPPNSYVTVTNANDGRSVVVRIIQHGLDVDGRIMSLSATAFNQIADLDQAVIPCLVTVK